MNLRLYLRVVGRFWYVALAGALVAIAVATSSVASIDRSRPFPYLEYREGLTYASSSLLFITESDSQWLRTAGPVTAEQLQAISDAQALQEEAAAKEPVGKDATVKDDSEGSKKSGGNGTGTSAATPPANDPVDPSTVELPTDPSRLPGLAALYPYFVESDAVRGLVGKGDDARSVRATSVVEKVGGGKFTSLPLLQISATASSAEAAIDLASRANTAFIDYLTARQAEAGVPEDQRVQVEVVNSPREAEVVAPRAWTRPVAIGVAVFMLAIGLVFVLENLFPRGGPPDESEADDHDDRSNGSGAPITVPTRQGATADTRASVTVRRSAGFWGTGPKIWE